MPRCSLAARRSGAPGHFTSGACRCAARTMSKPPSGAHEVSSYLQSIGRDDCFHAVVHQGFYTSMDALRQLSEVQRRSFFSLLALRREEPGAPSPEEVQGLLEIVTDHLSHPAL